MRNEDKMTELYRLMTEEILGTISSADGKKMSILLEEEWARKEWDKFHKAFETEDALDKVALLIKKEAVNRDAEIADSRKKRKSLLAATIAGMLVLLGGVCFWLYSGKSVTASGLPNGITLQLSDGQTIDISATTRFQSGNALFFNDTATHTLSYTLTPNANGAMNVLKVPAGKRYNLRMPDGTQIALNASTELYFPSAFIGAHREVTVQGEAFFQIAKNAAQPFIVHLARTRIEVLGTSFNVNTYDSAAIKVSLRDGAIRLATSKKSLLLQPGSQATVTTENDVTIQSTPSTEYQWLGQGQYIMDNTPLEALTVIFPDWFGVPVVIDDTAINQHRFTGAIFRNEPLDSFLPRLEFAARVRTYYSGSVLHIANGVVEGRMPEGR